LSQVKKYGIEDQEYVRTFVRTKDGVTDDNSNYLPRATDYSHSHIMPDPDRNNTPEKVKEQTRAARQAFREATKAV